MKSVTMANDVTIIEELAGRSSARIYCLKYKQLATDFAGDTSIEVKYYSGHRARRVKLLEGLGFVLKETIWPDDGVPHHEIRQVWAR